MRVINQQLWVCGADRIVVLDQRDLRQLRTIRSPESGQVYDVAPVLDSDVVIATEEGLYHTHMSGKYLNACSHTFVRLIYLHNCAPTSTHKPVRLIYLHTCTPYLPTHLYARISTHKLFEHSHNVYSKITILSIAY